MVNKKVINEAKSNKSVPTPKKVVKNQAKSVCLSPFKIILKDKSKKSLAKQTPKKKKKSSEHPDSVKSPRRSSLGFKNTPEEPRNAEKTTQNSSEEPYDTEKTTPTRSSPMKTKSASTSGASQAAPSSKVVNKQKSAKRKLYTESYPNMQVRNLNDTFSDLQDDEEDEDDEQKEKEKEEVENEDKENEEVENKDKENENDGEDHDVGNEN
ncbi:YTH domain-containing protein 1-like [Papaver somniferum]|uniref:YTH domain-containing protein 1-like n=1 Tax=Papaver somniferum TaxID=3469 RepID=UPI000E6FA563|nr:YTH domain-containing protein 1-like [Papaver somniferum]